MTDEVVASPQPLIDVDEPASPAPGAEEQKPNDSPSGAEAQKPEAAETPEQQEAKKQSRTQRRFERQKTARIQAETEARILREQLAELKGHRSSSQQESGEPQRDQYQDYESYLRAVAKYDAEQVASQALKKANEASQGKAEQDKAAANDAKAAQQWVEREKAFQAATKDYDEVVMPYVEEDLGQLSDVARRAIVDSDVGPQVLYHLASNPDDAERIAGLSPHRQAVEIGKLEAKMSAPAPKASNAPAPIKPLQQGRSAPNGYSENMSDAEYRAWRKSQGARWAQ